MKFIKDIEGDLVNMEKMEHIFIVDKGQDYPDRFHILAATQAHEYLLKKYRTESAANGFLRRIHEHYKFEVTE